MASNDTNQSILPFIDKNNTSPNQAQLVCYQ